MAKTNPAPMANYLEKEPTSLHENFADWLTRQTGYEVDLKTVQLATALRMTFQRSEDNQSDLEARRQAQINAVAEREKRAAEREAARAAKEKAAAEKAAAKKAAPAAEKAVAPKKATKAAAAKAAPAEAPAKAAGGPKRRKAVAK